MGGGEDGREKLMRVPGWSPNNPVGERPARMEVMFYLILMDNFTSSKRKGREGQTEEEQDPKLRGWPV